MPEGQQPASPVPAASDRNMFAAFSYVWFIAIIMIFIKRQDKFVMFHAKQALILAIVSLVYWIPFIGWTIGWIISAVVFIACVIGFINAWQGKEYQIPVVYQLSKMLPL